MNTYTAVVFYLDDHSTLVLHYDADEPQRWPSLDDDRAYIVVAVFAGDQTSVYSDTTQDEQRAYGGGQ
jgi:hypothetical protein